MLAGGYSALAPASWFCLRPMKVVFASEMISISGGCGDWSPGPDAVWGISSGGRCPVNAGLSCMMTYGDSSVIQFTFIASSG